MYLASDAQVARYKAYGEVVFNNDTVERKASDNNGYTDLDDGIDLGVKIYVGDVAEININDVGYTDDVDDDVAMKEG
ncbi:MAG: hypothetical protein LQ338_008194, partial [Usnochroma carphineum]